MAFSVYSDERFMQEALRQALLAKEKGEIPVGAIVVCENRIIAKAYNQTETLNDATAHAEMIALTSGFNFLGSKYLNKCSLFVTLEPCCMCAGALFWSQIGRVVYGAEDYKRGFSIISSDILHPKTKVTKGIKEQECRQLLDDFFDDLRR
ncbi:MAG: nucleoside deaminase [Candidatus Cyclobacteriaceae bacterium M3_2C_046]